MICLTWITNYRSIILIVSYFITYVQSDVPRPRGVSLSKAPLYSPTKDFTCFDGTMTIPFSYVNDDYCDCFDGSDEPGTSACLNGVFHCTNAGHRPQNIPSSRVNDAVCDCCDGTDEYASTVTCSNTCEELGKEAKAEAQRIAELYKAGSHLRLELIEKGNSIRNEMAEQLSQLEKDKAEAEKIKEEKELLKNTLEAKENDALKVYREAEQLEKEKKAEQEKQNTIKEAMEKFDNIDSDQDGLLTIDEIKASNVFDRNNDGEVDEDEVTYFFGERESVDKNAFLDNIWSLVKLAMIEQAAVKPGSESENMEPAEEGDEDSVGDLDNEDLEQEEEGDDHGDLDNADHEPEDAPVHSSVYDEETQKLVDAATEARREHTEAEHTVREIESNIRKIQQNLEKDYGLQQEYATLDNQCWEYEDKEYVYKLCLFQKVTQKSKNGGAEVGLGNWGEWGGPSHNKYSVMKYTNGVACWNGPNRITTVNIGCGLETKLLSVTEPYRCEYKIEFITPAACDDVSNAPQHSSHDEL